MTAISFLEHSTFAGGSEGLDSVELSFLHLCLVLVVNDGDRFTCVNYIRSDSVSTKILNALDLLDFIALPWYHELVGLHDLLDSSSYIAKSHIRASLFDTFVCGLFRC